MTVIDLLKEIEGYFGKYQGSQREIVAKYLSRYDETQLGKVFDALVMRYEYQKPPLVATIDKVIKEHDEECRSSPGKESLSIAQIIAYNRVPALSGTVDRSGLKGLVDMLRFKMEVK